MSLKAICPVKASTKALKVQMNGRVSQVVNCTLNLPLRKHIFRGKFKTKNNSVCENDISTKKRTLFAPSDGLLVRNRKLSNFGKICSKFFFLTLFSIIFLFESKNTCFLLIPVKFVAVLRKIKFLKN